jgi:tetratricopeptide (TPR) repeat protein
MELIEGEDFLEHVRPTGLRRPAVKDPPAAPSASNEVAVAVAPTLRVSPLDAPASTLDEGRLRAALLQLGGAIAALHAAGVVHRDIKPSNIRVTSAGRLVLLDFGLAIDATKDRSMTMSVYGTPAYMAPEQAMSGDVGPEADWYSVGVLLYEALTGVLPFDGSPLEIMMRKQSHTPAPPRTLVPELPVYLDALCVGLLQFDPKQRPTAASVLRSLGATETTASASRASTADQAPFVGREAELDALRAAFRDSRGAESVSVLVKGESGVGKSCLVRRFVTTLSLEEPELVVLAGRCYEREAVPYKALDGVVDALARVLAHEGGALAERILPRRPESLAQVFPVLRRVDVFANATRGPAAVADPVELRSRAFAAMREMLGRLAAARPCVVVIDDLQWADADSLALLAEIMRPPEEPAFLFVATVRAVPPDASTATLKILDLLRFIGVALAGRARSIVMDRMPEQDARVLITRLLERNVAGARSAFGLPAGQAAAAALTETIAREAAGHPLFIDALVRHSALASEAFASSRLEDALWSHVASLAPGPRRVMQILTVAGAPVTQEVLADAVGGDRAEVSRHVSLLRVAHLASITGARANDTIEPYHDRIRAAVLANIADDVRVACHRALAVALERAPHRELEALALNWRGAGDAIQAARYAVRAADEAAGALAFDRAAGLYETAIELGPKSGSERSALLERLGDALANAGHGKRAAAAYGEASLGSQAARSLDLQRRGADQLLRAGHFDEGLATIGRVLTSIGLTLPASPFSAVLVFLGYRAYLRLRGLGFRARDASQITATDLTRVDICWSLAFGLALADTLRGAAFNARNLVLALRSGERSRIARAVALEACFVSSAGGPAARRAEVLVQRAHALAGEGVDPYAIGWMHAASAARCYFVGRYERTLEHTERATAAWTEVPGTVWERDTMLFFSTNSLVQLGKIGRVAREVPKAVRDARQRGDTYAAVNLRIGLANVAWLAVDEVGEAVAQIDEAMSEWSKQGFHLEHFYEFLARTNALLYSARAREALGHVTARWPALRRSLLPRTVQSVRIYSLHALGRSAIATAEEGGTDRAPLLRDAARAARRIERERMDWATPCATLLRAGIAVTAKGGVERAVPLLREAISGFTAADMALYAAASRRCLGTLLGGDEGRDLVHAADEWMASESIKNPTRMTAMFAPGFARLG